MRQYQHTPLGTAAAWALEALSVEVLPVEALAITAFSLGFSIGDGGALRAAGEGVRRSTATTCAGRSLAAAAAICSPAASLHPARASSQQLLRAGNRMP